MNDDSWESDPSQPLPRLRDAEPACVEIDTCLLFDLQARTALDGWIADDHKEHTDTFLRTAVEFFHADPGQGLPLRSLPDFNAHEVIFWTNDRFLYFCSLGNGTHVLLAQSVPKAIFGMFLSRVRQLVQRYRPLLTTGKAP